MTNILVIIPVKNEADKIARCLEAVFTQSLKPHEVIVVDGHSRGCPTKITAITAKKIHPPTNK